MKGLFYTYLACYGGALVSLINPFIGLLIYLNFAIMKPEALWHWMVPRGNYSRIVAIGLLLGWAIHGFGTWNFGKAKATFAFLILFWVWITTWIFLADDPESSTRFVENMSKIFVPVVVGLTLIDSIAKLRQLAWVLTSSIGYLAFEANLAYLNGINVLQETNFVGVDNNTNAIMFNTGIGMAFFLALSEKNNWTKLLALGLAACMTHAVLISFSRGGMMGMLVTGVVAFLILPKKPAHYALFFVALLVTARLTGKEVIERFGTGVYVNEEGEREASAESRLILWGHCVQCLQEHPIGIGPDQFPEYIGAKGAFGGKKKEAHSLWFQTAAELGWPGILSLGAFYGLTFVRLLRYAWPSVWVPDPWLRYGAMMAISSMAGFMASASFVTVEGMEAPYYVVLLGCGVLKLASTPILGTQTASQTQTLGYEMYPRGATF